MSINTGLDITDIAPPTGDAWRPEVGDTVKGTIVYVGTSERVSQFSGKTERSLRIDLDTETGQSTVYATLSTDIDGGGYAKRDAKAIVAAVRAAGSTKIDVGGTLAIKRIADIPTDRGAAKAFQAQYKPPADTPPAADDGAVDDLI